MWLERHCSVVPRALQLLPASVCISSQMHEKVCLSRLIFVQKENTIQSKCVLFSPPRPSGHLCTLSSYVTLPVKKYQVIQSEVLYRPDWGTGEMLWKKLQRVL